MVIEKEMKLAIIQYSKQCLARLVSLASDATAPSKRERTAACGVVGFLAVLLYFYSSQV
jgi:hypothetical protein